MSLLALTPKKEAFCRNIVSGMTNKDAYLNAYNSKGSEQNAWNEAWKLLNDEEVQNYIKVLRKPLEEHAQTQALNARSEQIAFIRERIAICKAKEDEQSIIRYTHMLNQIHGIYKEDSTPEEQKNNLSNVDTDTLAKLVNAV